MKNLLWVLAIGILYSCGTTNKSKTSIVTAKPVNVDSVKKASKPSIADKVKAMKKVSGLFDLYQDTATGSVKIVVKKNQLGKDYIYQSFSMGGPTTLGLNQNMIRNTWVFNIKKSWDKLEFSQKNTNFYYNPNDAVSKSKNVDVADAVFYMEKIEVEDSTGYLVNADGLLLGDKMDMVKPMMSPMIPPGMVFNLGGLNPAKSKYERIQSFDKNTDVVVNLAYDNPMPLNGGGKDITDARYVRVKMQHSFLEMPEPGFEPRRDDPRVGYFTQEVDDLTGRTFTPQKDMINRWRLVKKDPNAAISEPVTPITYWIENTTPVELRPVIKEAGEKWNEAFEKAGFKNAIVMKEMPDDAKWNPADLQYNVIRWVSSAYAPYGAIGPSFVNPLTGEILGADITVEWASGKGFWGRQNDLFNTAAVGPQSLEQALASQDEAISIYGKKHSQTCNLAKELNAQYIAGMAAVSALDGVEEDEESTTVTPMHRQFLYYLIMHEMGHTLGLNHNMKATQMLSPAEMNNTAITHVKGLQGSVMDYPAINVSLDRSKQGDYYTTKVGPYDVWAIQYGYTPFAANEEEAGLNKILRRSNEPDLAFGNDADDMRSPGNGIDPRVMINDHSNDMVKYAEERFKLVNTAIPKLQNRFVKDGRSYQTLVGMYSMLAGQRMSMASALSRYVGGVYVDRSFPEQKSGNKPYAPVPVALQKSSLATLAKYVFAPNAFDADQALYPYLQIQRRGFNFFGNTEDYKYRNRPLAMQMNALAGIMNATTLSRITNTQAYGNTYSVAEVMNDLVGYIFREDIRGTVNPIRQNLQTEFVKGLVNMVNSPMGGYDNASKAAALYSLRQIRNLVTPSGGDASSIAHRAALAFLIDKALVIK